MGRVTVTGATSRATAAKVQYLGIDFGSSNTSVVAKVVRGRSEPYYVVFFENEEDRPFFATAMGRGKDGEYAFFSGACKQISNGTLQPVEELKEGFGKDGFENGKRFLEAVIRKIQCAKDEMGSVYDFSELEGIGFGMPAYFDEEEQETYRRNMRTVLSGAFGIDPERIVGRAEPELAAVAYNVSGKGGAGRNPRPGDGLLVLDFGGYTLDVAVMKFVEDRGTRRRLLLNSCNCGSFRALSCLPMGKGITAEICKMIYGEGENFDYNVDKAKCDLFRDETYDRIEVGNGQPRYRLRTNKFLQMRYCYDGTAQAGEDAVRVGMTPGGESSGCLSLDLESVYDGLVTNVFNYLNWIMNGSEPLDFRYVLFTGGGSGMKPLRDKVLAKMRSRFQNDPVALWMDDLSGNSLMLKTTAESSELRSVPVSSANAVALGACLIATNEKDFLTVSAGRPQSADAAEVQRLKLELSARNHVYNMALGMLIDLGKRDLAQRLDKEMREYMLKISKK